MASVTRPVRVVPVGVADGSSAACAGSDNPATPRVSVTSIATTAVMALTHRALRAGWVDGAVTMVPPVGCG